MKKEITISELARLMKVSVHQIRYFEDKGVLPPAFIDDNQYRKYGLEEIYRLAHILLLRKLGVSVPTIKECFTSFGSVQYEELLERSLHDTASEIARLQELQRHTLHILEEHRSFAASKGRCMLKQRAGVHLLRWLELGQHDTLHAALLVAQPRQVPELFEADIHYIRDDRGRVGLYIESEQPADLELPTGSYLSIQTLASDEEELELPIQLLQDYAAEHALVACGPLVVVEKSYLSLFTPDQLHYELLLPVASLLERA